MRTVAMLFFLALAFCPARQPAFAAQPSAGRLLPYPLKGFAVWQEDILRVCFMRTGEHAVAEVDANGNGCPDFVEDVAKQILASRDIFHSVVALPDPLHSKRYSGVRYIDVFLYDSKKMKGSRGMAFDEVSLSREYPLESTGEHSAPRGEPVKTLVIYCSIGIDPKKNLTPAHEYFHLVQNGISYIKNTWYFEGMAGWSMDALGRSWVTRPNMTAQRAKNVLSVLHDTAARDVLLYASTKIAANKFWKPLAQLCPEAHITIPVGAPVLRWRYSDGSPVVQDRMIAGAALMREILYRLGKADERAFAEQAYGKWTEANQRNALNEAYIFEAIAGAATLCAPGAI